MRRIIRLSDLEGMPVEPSRYPERFMKAARVALCALNLRFDNSTGIVRDTSGIIQSFVNASDHVPHNSEQEVMRWVFSMEINNEADRIMRNTLK